MVVGGGVEEVEAEGGGEGWGEDVRDDGGFEESWGEGGGGGGGGLGRWRGVCWRKGRGGKGGEGEREKCIYLVLMLVLEVVRISVRGLCSKTPQKGAEAARVA